MGVASGGIEVLGVVADMLGHEGADEEVAVVVALQEQQQSCQHFLLRQKVKLDLP